MEHPSKNRLSNIDRDTGREIATLTPQEINALQWLRVSRGFIESRIEQYKKGRNSDAQSEDFMGAQLATLEFLEEKVSMKDPDVILLLSFNEEDASNGREVETPNYIVSHGNQLDTLAAIVEQSQYLHDNSLMD
ncbi:MAG TPA: hypothetical protein VGO98_01325 [Candidatus Saccharimonadales bacterium]|jgi:hypothetical protein|nr:hypothetical protein [Candidatus Saccharimonadales bacterium]